MFNYTGGNDTYMAYNPSNVSEPPFLEELVEQQRNSEEFNTSLALCTSDGTVSTQCLYDSLLTNNNAIAMATMTEVDRVVETMAAIGGYIVYVFSYASTL